MDEDRPAFCVCLLESACAERRGLGGMDGQRQGENRHSGEDCASGNHIVFGPQGFYGRRDVQCEMVEEHIGCFPRRLRRGDQEMDRVIGDREVEAQEGAAFLFLAHHLVHVVHRFRPIDEIERQGRTHGLRPVPLGNAPDPLGVTFEIVRLERAGDLCSLVPGRERRRASAGRRRAPCG